MPYQQCGEFTLASRVDAATFTTRYIADILATIGKADGHSRVFLAFCNKNRVGGAFTIWRDEAAVNTVKTGEAFNTAITLASWRGALGGPPVFDSGEVS